jgi:hypothetical protein
MLEIIRSVAVRDHVLPQPYARRQLRLEDVAFVEEQNQIRPCKERVRYNGLPEEHRIFL